MSRKRRPLTLTGPNWLLLVLLFGSASAASQLQEKKILLNLRPDTRPDTVARARERQNFSEKLARVSLGRPAGGRAGGLGRAQMGTLDATCLNRRLAAVCLWWKFKLLFAEENERK